MSDEQVPSTSRGDQRLRQVLLSEYYQKNKGISPEVLEKYRNQVRAIMSQDVQSQEDKIFVNDFLSSICEIRMGESKPDPVSQPRQTLQTKVNVETRQEQVRSDNHQAQTIKLNELVVVPEKFDGNRSRARRWLDDYERASASNSWTRATMAKYFQAYLTSSATDWFAVLVQGAGTNQFDWNEIRSAFCRYYVGRDEDLALERMLKDSLQGINESCSAFIARYARLMLLSDPQCAPSKLIGAIRIRLKPEIVERLASHDVATLEALNVACAGIEDSYRASRAAERLRETRKSRQDKPMLMRPRPSTDVRRQIRTDSRRQVQKSAADIVCHRCGHTGHRKKDCFAAKKKDGTVLKDRPPNEPPSGKSVAVVGNDESDEETPPKITVSKKICSTIIANCSTMRRNLLLLDVKLNGVSMQALVDTGSESSILNAETASLNGFVPKGPAPDLSTANGCPMHCFGVVKANLSVELGDTRKDAEGARFVVTDNLCQDVIIGMDLLHWLRIVIDTENRGLSFKPEPKGLLARAQIIPPRAQVVVEASLPTGIVGAVQTIPFNGGDASILVANSIDKVYKQGVRCLVTNIDNRPCTLVENQKIASFEQMSHEGELVAASMAIGASQAFVTVGNELDEEQLAELSRVLVENQQAFSLQGELGCTNVLEHDIELVEGAKPCNEPLRRRPFVHKEETKRQIRDMLDKGIIEDSSSPWASAYVLARKKSGEMRLCVDFRRLNDVTKKCVYPLPNVEDCIETLAGKKYFSQLDMASGFWQLPLTPRARELTAFRVEDGHFQFTRMPFGLTNAPASFQRLVNVLFSGLKGLNLQVFIDDLCIATNTWSEHMDMLTKVLRLLIQANLKLKSNKCLLAVSKVNFLGHELSAHGIRQDPAKLAAIRNIPVPKNVKELRAALGMMNYYRKFVPGFAIVTAPMTALLRKNNSFKWEVDQQKAFDQVIELLLANATLAHFQQDKPVALKTDACKLGVAAILLQQHEQEWRIVCCCSRRLTPSEENYGVTELEALAIIYAVTKLRHYLLGRRFRIVTDHCALCAVFKNPSTSARLNRWRLILQEFDYEVIYTKGSMHSDVDCLSRMPLPNETDDFLEEKTYAIMRRAPQLAPSTLATPLDLDGWAALTGADPQAKEQQSKAKHRRDGFKMTNGLLYYKKKLFVPAAKRTQLLQSAHSGVSASHGGIKVTLDRLEAFWWPQMSRDVTEHVETCHECQMRKVPRVRPSGQLTHIAAREPLELVSIDCLGPLPESLGRKRHVIVAVDVFTRFVIAKAAKDQRGSTFIKFLKQFVGILGVPRAILTDNGPFFCNELVSGITSTMQIKHVRSTAHFHQGNAVAERMIQSIEDKLAILINSQAADLDWEDALPQVMLSINASVCASTGFSPFELLYGRKATLCQAEFDYESPEMRAYLREKNNTLGRVQEAARAAQEKNKRTSKERYDAAHEPREFAVGELVLVKRHGRLSKLAPKFDGPFEVVERTSNNVYRLKCGETSKTIERHTSDMKRYSVLCSAILLIASVRAVFERAPPVLWTESEKFVSPGPSKVKVRIYFRSPCEILHQVTQGIPEISEAVMRCEQVWQDNVQTRLNQFDPRVVAAANQAPAANRLNNQVLLPMNGGQMPPNHAPMSQDPNRHLGKRDIRAWTSQNCKTNKLRHAIVRPQNLTNSGLIVNCTESKLNGQARSCNPVHNWANIASLSTIEKLSQPGRATDLYRERRDLGILSSFTTIACVTCVLETVVSRLWGSPAVQELKDHELQIKATLDNLVRATNLTQLNLIATQEAVANQAVLIAHNAASIHDLQIMHPQLMVTAAHIIAKIVVFGSDLDRLHLSIRRKRLDVGLLSSLANTDALDTIEAESIAPSTIESRLVASDALEIGFVGRLRDATTQVFSVEAFSFWTNLTEEQSSLMEYKGPEFLIYNSTNHCVKAIGQPKNRWVNARCDEANYEDHQLARWEPKAMVSDPWAQPSHTIVKESWPHVFIYCWPKRITRRGGTEECPPFIARLNASEPFNTSDYVYSPSAVEIVNRMEMITMDVHSIHFLNHSHAVDENAALRALKVMREHLREANRKLYLINWSDTGGVTHVQTMYAILVFCGLAIGAHIVLTVKARRVDSKRHHKVTRIVSDAVYGSQMYETLHGTTRPSKEQQPTTVINIPMTHAPLPAVKP